ncbi:hypothetical protein IFR05_016191 [Cadophora sp. M221]|nr:hypothetical protein IFR05_016191 [Cadophora sp. M221]
MHHCSASARTVDLLCGNLSLGERYYENLMETGISIMMQILLSNTQHLQGIRVSASQSRTSYPVACACMGEPWLPAAFFPKEGQQGSAARNQTQEDIIHRRDEIRVYALHDKHTSYWKVISQGRLSLRKGTASQGHIAVRMVKDEGVRALTVLSGAQWCSTRLTVRVF